MPLHLVRMDTMLLLLAHFAHSAREDINAQEELKQLVVRMKHRFKGLQNVCLRGRFLLTYYIALNISKAGFTSTAFPVAAPYGFYKNSSGVITQCP